MDRFGCSVKHFWGGIQPTTHPQSVLLSGSAPSWVRGRLEQLPVSGQGSVQKCVLSVVLLSSIKSPLRPLMMPWLQTPRRGRPGRMCAFGSRGGACAGGGPQLTVCRFIAVYNKISSSSHTVAVGTVFLSRKKCPVGV